MRPNARCKPTGRTAASVRDEAQANRALLDKGFISPTRMLALDQAEDYASRLAEHEADLARAKQEQTQV